MEAIHIPPWTCYSECLIQYLFRDGRSWRKSCNTTTCSCHNIVCFKNDMHYLLKKMIMLLPWVVRVVLMKWFSRRKLFLMDNESMLNHYFLTVIIRICDEYLFKIFSNAMSLTLQIFFCYIGVKMLLHCFLFKTTWNVKDGL